MRRVFFSCGLFFLSSLSLLAHTSSSYEGSYSELAKKYVYPSYEKLEEDVFSLKHSVLPHDVKALRKEVGQARFYLDFFVFAYPKYENLDFIRVLRKHLDKGYDVLGLFKDLFDGLGLSQEEVTKEHYKEVWVKLKKRRKAVLSWQKSLRNFSENNFIQLYLESPLEGKIQEREAEDLSRFVWRFVDPPRVEKENFAQILSRYLIASLERAEKLYKKVLKIENVFDHHEQEEIFHGFRKTLRYVLKMETYFPGFFDLPLEKGESFKVLTEAVKTYGDLNDEFMKVNTLVADLDGASMEETDILLEKLSEVKEEAFESWQKLLSWQEESKVLEHLRNLKKRLLDSGSK